MKFARVPLIIIVAVNLLSKAVSGKIYKKCDLVRELQNFDIAEEEIATWVCIVQHESNYDTAAMNPGSGDHGLFQISQVYWCSPPGYGCNTPCSKFRDDDISDDLRCIRRIFNEHKRITGNGFKAWAVYPLYCKNDTAKYTKDCFDVSDSSVNNTVNNEADDDDGEYGDGYHFPPLPKLKLPFDKESISYAVPVKNLPFSKTSIHHFVTVLQDVTTTDDIETTTMTELTTDQPAESRLVKRVLNVSEKTAKQVTFAPDSFFSWLFNSQTLPPVVPPLRPTRPQNFATTFRPVGEPGGRPRPTPPGLQRPGDGTQVGPGGRPRPQRPGLSGNRRPHRRPGHRPFNSQSTELDLVRNVTVSRAKQGFPGAVEVKIDKNFVFFRRAPIVVSFPHFLYADWRYSRNVKGLSPNETKHQIFVTLEPISGTPLKAATRIQFNLFLRPVRNISSIENVTETLVPLFWIEELTSLPQKYQDVITGKLYRNIFILNAIKYVLLAIALIIITVCILIFLYTD